MRMRDTRWVFEAIPVQYLRSVIREAAPSLRMIKYGWYSAKALNKTHSYYQRKSLMMCAGNKHKKAVFAGPSFAADLANKQVTAVSVAATDCKLAHELQSDA